jgi:hypothetical protein
LHLWTKIGAILKRSWVESKKMDDVQNTKQGLLQSTFVRITEGWVSIGLDAGLILVGLTTVFKYSTVMLTAQITCSAIIICTGLRLFQSITE